MVHARDLKFSIQIPQEKIVPHEKIVDPYFFFMSELCPFENKILKSCVQDISKSI